MEIILLLCTIVLNITSDYLDRASTRNWNPYLTSLWGSAIQFLLILPFIGLVHDINLRVVGLCGLAGMVSAYGRVPWYRALANAHESLAPLAPFLRLSSVIVLLLAWLILDEPITFSKGCGSLLIVFAAMVILMDNPDRTQNALLTKHNECFLVFFFAVSTAITAFTYKLLLNSGEPLWTIYFALKLFQALFQFLIVRGEKVFLKTVDFFNHFRLFVFSRVLQTIAAILYLLVLSRINLSSVEPVMAVGPFLYFVIDRIVAYFKFRNSSGTMPVAVAPQKKPLRINQVVAAVMLSAGIFFFYSSSL